MVNVHLKEVNAACVEKMNGPCVEKLNALW